MKLRSLAEAGTDNSDASYGSDNGVTTSDAGSWFSGSGLDSVNWGNLVSQGINAYTTISTTQAKLDAQSQAQQLALQQAQLQRQYPYGYTYSSTGQLIPANGSSPLLGTGVAGVSATTIIGVIGLAIAAFTLMKDK